MNNTTKIVIAILALLNITLMTFLYLGKPNKRSHKQPRQIIIQKLGFDESQTKEYLMLIEEHHRATKKLQKEIMANKKTLYQGIVNEDKAFNDSLIQLIGKKFKEMERVHYAHFLGIKNICKEDQEEKFKELSIQLPKILAPHQRGPKRKRH